MKPIIPSLILEITASDLSRNDIMKEVIEGPTPAGGVRSEVYYFDENYISVDKSQARNIVIREIAADGTLLQETFGTVGRPCVD
jgi:hypothetical protein